MLGIPPNDGRYAAQEITIANGALDNILSLHQLSYTDPRPLPLEDRLSHLKEVE